MEGATNRTMGNFDKEVMMYQRDIKSSVRNQRKTIRMDRAGL